MGERIRATDWSGTPLGPMAAWPQSLRTAVGICTESRFPMLIWWGPDAIQLYNDAYVPVLGAKHPRSLGQRGMECWAEIWDVLGPLYVEVMRYGRSTWSDDLLLLMDRYGYVEETYFTFSYSPIRDESGGVGGLLVTCAETTARVVGERRLRTLRDLASRGSEARTVGGACALAMSILGENTADVPSAALYLVDGTHPTLSLAGSAGARGRWPASVALEPTALGEATEADPRVSLREVIGSGQALELHEHLAALELEPDNLTRGRPAEGLVLPVTGAAQATPIGCLVVAASPRRRIDDSYRGFFELIAGHLASAIANARAYEESEARAQALAELDRAKTAFFSNVSHEFRTPLTLLLGPLEDALADRTSPLPEVQRERVEVAQRNSLRLLRLVNTLLDVARVEAGRMDAAFEPTDLAAYTVDLASGFRSAAERAGLRFTVDCPPLEAPVYVDREMWEKIVFNLLSNALKFTLAGEIAVRLTADETMARLEVRDTGSGIAAHELPRIFERFHRVREAGGRTHEGTGIGLALVQELARLHGGAVSAASVPGQGSTFEVTLPCGPGHLPPEQLRRAPARVPRRTPESAAFVSEAERWGAPSRTAGEAGSRIVVADDNADMRDYVVRLLGEGWRVEAVPDGRAALLAVRRELPDLVLSDVMMPEIDGLSLLAALRADPETRGVPIILLSARAGEEARVQALEAGADDYLVKPFTARELVARVDGILALRRVRGEAEAALRESEERYRAFIAVSSEAVWRVELEVPVATELSPDVQIEHFYRYAYLAECNDAMARMYGYEKAADLLGIRLGDLVPQSDPANIEYLRAFIATGYRLAEAESNELDRDGRPRYFVNNLFGIVEDGWLVRAWGSQRDVTERRITLDRLQQAQRMESVGKLAGGIAHEVNNMMSVVLGCSEFVLRRMDLPQAVRADVEQVREAAVRSAAITAQLLAFSRRQLRQPVPLDLNDVVRDLEPVLRRTLGDAVALELRLGPHAAVMADRGQLHQVLLNLALNARDAMPEGGEVRIETSLVELGEQDVAVHPDIRLRLGPYALLALSDSGHGMDRATLSRVFEPFFTTKGVGKGTGLGLSTVYGIVKQSDGYIWVDSEPGRGTTFRMYLPMTEARTSSATASEELRTAAGHEMVLVAEDEAMVRVMAARTLEQAGFRVLAVESGGAALDVLALNGPGIDLLLTDVAMPGMDGLELGRRVAELHPALPVLYMSGHPADEITRGGLPLNGHDFIAKPFAPTTLVETVRALLDTTQV